MSGLDFDPCFFQYKHPLYKVIVLSRLRLFQINCDYTLTESTVRTSLLLGEPIPLLSHKRYIRPRPCRKPIEPKPLLCMRFAIPVPCRVT